MRMRKLAQGHSLVMLAPPEIDRDIREVAQRKTGTQSDTIDSLDVLRWILEQPRLRTRRDQPLWVTQGLNHRKRALAAKEFHSGKSSTEILLQTPDKIEKYLSVIQERDALTLHEMYAPRTHKDILAASDSDIEDLELKELAAIGRALGRDCMAASSVHEEQEKELAHEVEQQTQVQRPPPIKPRPHMMHPAVRRSIKTGAFPCQGTPSFLPAYTILDRTSAGRCTTLFRGRSELWTTVDFAWTSEHSAEDKIDDYLRPVNFILAAPNLHPPIFLILSPFEVNFFLEDIRQSHHVRLHLYAPRTTRSMESLEAMTFYNIGSIPFSVELDSALARDLQIFAGQLYIETYKKYREFCEHLAVPESDVCGTASSSVASLSTSMVRLRLDGDGKPHKIAHLDFLRAILEARRKGQDFTRTHLGQIVLGQILTEDAFNV